MYVTAIVLAAGRGKRFKSRIPKPFIKINSQPVIIYPLKTLSSHPAVREIIVVVDAKNSNKILKQIRRYRIGKIKAVVEGGKRRQDSVRNGLRAIDRRTGLVLVHDGVRPFINRKMVSRVIREASVCGAAIVGMPVKATIKKIKNEFIVEKTLNRNNLWEAQTPQVFKKDLILKAYKKFGHSNVTDDAVLVEKLGAKVRAVLGSYNNIKITTPEDLIIAEAIVKNKYKF